MWQYHFSIPLSHTSPILIKKSGNTTLIPGNGEHCAVRVLQRSSLRTKTPLSPTLSPHALHPPVRWGRTMPQSRHRTSLGVTGCRKERRERSRQCRIEECRLRCGARMSTVERSCRGVSRATARSLEFTKRQQSRRPRSTLRHYNKIQTDWRVTARALGTVGITKDAHGATVCTDEPRSASGAVGTPQQVSMRECMGMSCSACSHRCGRLPPRVATVRSGSMTA